MIKIICPCVLTCLMMTGFLPIKDLPPKSFVGKVVSIADGDTVTVLYQNQQHKIRLSGIDAPESHQAFDSVTLKDPPQGTRTSPSAGPLGSVTGPFR